ncbi:amidase signature enzyme [Obba rivulosa]|uniref:Glutamyl-tRNA(Gln) amidotransferase subunit A, mitochondrial n=1 Tax=Obba rivulosa TaxID=1052685 RepID=A0A8E2J750_9APHY|nr:amidase signature enzyme [Obba rivulosa]
MYATCRQWREPLHLLARCRHLHAINSTLDTRNASINAVVHPARISPSVREPASLLYDFSVAVKDNICTSSMPTTCSSAILKDFMSPFDATVVKLLQNNGADIIGKTNCDEFGMGSENKYSVYGPVVHPHQPPNSDVPWENRERRSAGGSSGGSAAAVAAGLCRAALATDTGGSTRLPAAYCGVAGFKPSYGIISRWGVVSYADSLDCVGIVTEDVDDAGKLFGVLSAHDPKDPSAARPETRAQASAHCQYHLQQISGADDFSGLRIGIPQEYFPEEMDRSMHAPLRRILDNLMSRGATVLPVSLPSTPYALSAYYVISSAEASSNMARYDGIRYGSYAPPPLGSDKMKTANVYAHTRSQGFGPEVQKRILLGTYALSADAFDNYFLQAQRVRRLIKADFDRVFAVPNVLSSGETPEDGVHVLLHPSAIRTAPPLDEGQNADLGAYVQDVLTVPASLAGLPALSVPAGLGEDGWPVGISVVGQWGCDEMVLNVGRMVEHARSL